MRKEKREKENEIEKQRIEEEKQRIEREAKRIEEEPKRTIITIFLFIFIGFLFAIYLRTFH